MDYNYETTAPHSLAEWKKNPTFNDLFWVLSSQYFGYQTDDNEICLAKVRERNVASKHIAYYLGMENTHKHQRIEDYTGKNVILIQIGAINQSLSENWHIPRAHEDQTNLILTDSSRLLLLPVPIPFTFNESDYNHNYNQNDLINHRWKVTPKMYKDGYEFCIKAIDFAKRGDWDSFQREIVNNPIVVK